MPRKLLKKGAGKEAKLSFSAHALMDNRHGLLSAATLTQSVGCTEAEAALQMIDRRKQRKIKSIGGDKGYDTNAFVAGLRKKAIAPHIAKKQNKRTAGLDGRTTRTQAYRASQIVRKRIEQIFGWFKTVGGMRKTRLRGVERNRAQLFTVGSAYNLLRMSRLVPLV